MTLTTNLQLSKPSHLAQSGIWDGDMNGNFDILDSIWGGVANIGLSSTSPVTLSTTQWQSQIIKLSGTITTDITVFFPALGGHHIIYNNTIGSGSNDFVVILSTNTASRVIGLPTGEIIDIAIDGNNIDFRNLGRVGDTFEFHGATAPRWIGLCTVPPYLFCDGSSFSTITYPALTRYLGGANTLPDARGRARFSMNSGQNRITTAVSGVNGDVTLSAGGDQRMHSHAHNAFIRDPLHHHGIGSSTTVGANNPTGVNVPNANTNVHSTDELTNVRVNSASGGLGTDDITATFGAGNSQNMPPAYIGGLTFIRAA